MLNVINNSSDPYLNMAVEEYVLTVLGQREDCFMLWQNRPAIIVGRHQNALEEINTEYVRANEIAVVRRLTGGGAVYHDLGNLNFTFVVKDEGIGFDFERFAQPVIKALAELGVEATHGGRNDITIAGRKFSGNAEYRHGKRLMHHGTLLFDSDLKVLGDALRVKASKIESKGVKSVRSRVTNIAQHVPPSISISDFMVALRSAAEREFGTELRPYELEQHDMEIIERLRKGKYATWDWNYGKAPAYNVQRARRYTFGEVDVRLNIRQGYIAGCHIFGDFFSHAELAALAHQLQGVRYDAAELRQAVAEIDVPHYFPHMDREQFLQLLIDL